MKTKDIVSLIAGNGFIATVAQVEELARQVHLGTQSTSTYLRVLVAGCQKRLPQPRKGKQADPVEQEAVINIVHGEFYAGVMRALSGDQPDQLELGRRTNFARSSASDLRGYVRRGHDLRTLDVLTVTKGSLRPITPKATGSRIERGAEVILAAVSRLAKKSVEDARGELEKAIERLTFALDGLEEEPTSAKFTHLERIGSRREHRAGPS